jgi:hypothetical protein
MLAQYRAGRQADALEAYRRIRTQLAAELGLDPGPVLQSLHQQILEHAPSLDTDLAAHSPSRPGRADGTNRGLTPKNLLPQPLTRLIGRDVDLLELEAISETPSSG